MDADLEATCEQLRANDPALTTLALATRDLDAAARQAPPAASVKLR